MSLVRSAGRGIAWTLVQAIGRHGIGFLVFLLLARLLHPEDFGLVAMAQSFVFLAGLLMDQGLAAAIVQRSQIRPDHLDTAFWANALLSVLLALGCLLFAPHVAAFFGRPELTQIVRWLSIWFPANAIGIVPRAVFMRDLRFREIAVAQLVGTGLGGVAGVAAAIAGAGVWSLVIQQVTAVFLSSSLNAIQLGWFPRPRFSADAMRDLYSFGISLFGANILNYVNRRSDDLLIGRFLGASALGVYSVAYSLLLVITQVTIQTVSTVAFPAFSRLQGDVVLLRKAYLHAIRYVSLVAFPVFAGVAVMAPQLVTVAFGERWLQAAPILSVLCVAGIVHSVFYFNDAVLKACGRSDWVLRITALNAVGNLVGFVIAVQYGVLAVAVAYALRSVVFSPVPVLALRRQIGLEVRVLLRTLYGPAASTLVTTGILSVVMVMLARWDLGPFPSLAIGAVAGTAVYSVCVSLFLPDTTRMLLQLVRGRGDAQA